MSRDTTSSPNHLFTAGHSAFDVPAPMALSMWYKSSGGAQGNFTYWISKLLVAGEHPSWGFSTNGSGALRFLIGHGLNGGDVVGSPAVAAGTAYDDNWHHVLGYYDSTNMGLYFDGVDQGVSSNPGLTIDYDDTKSLYFFTFDGSILFTAGHLGQVVLYNSVPTAAQIAAMADGFPPEVVCPQRLACVWDMNGMEPEVDRIAGRTLTNSGTTANRFIFPPGIVFPDQGD